MDTVAIENEIPGWRTVLVVGLSDSENELKDDLKKIVKRWKKEAGLYRSKAYKDKIKCRRLDLTLEMCAESIEALLCVRAP